jgi:hypothetical protein
MVELLYITFKDTVTTNDLAGQRIAITNIAAQLLAAAERIKVQPDAINDYLRSDSLFFPATLAKPEEIAGSIPFTPAPILAEEGLLDMLFKDIKRTQKTENILRYFLQNSGAELDVQQIAAGASITTNDLSAWLATVGKKIPAIINPSRGVYKFNPNQIT